MKKIDSYTKKIFSLPRGINSDGNIQTLKLLKKKITGLNIKYFKKRKVFDWVVPRRWSLIDGYISDIDNNKKLIDCKKNLLHIVQNSENIKKTISKEKLFKNLYFQKEKPNSIPYITSYYKKRWGFCIKYNDLKKFKKKKYFVRIKAINKNKPMPYGEIFIKGKSKKTIYLTTYICHPNLANDNLSGILMLSNLVRHLKSESKKNQLNYSFCILFISETIGSMLYIDKNLNKLKKNFVAGYVLTCLSNGKEFNIISKYKENLSFKFLVNFLKVGKINHKIRNWTVRGSDERQFSSPNVNLPFVCITKKKFGEYKEYHSSSDNLDFFNISNYNHSFVILKKFLNFINEQEVYCSKIKGEPFLSKRGLFTNISSSFKKIKNQDLVLNVFDFCDGKNSILDISKSIGFSENVIKKIINKLDRQGLIKKI